MKPLPGLRVQALLLPGLGPSCLLRGPPPWPGQPVQAQGLVVAGLPQVAVPVAVLALAGRVPPVLAELGLPGLERRRLV
jgi:hypothetical protein